MIIAKPIWGFLTIEEIEAGLSGPQFDSLLTHAYCLACIEGNPRNHEDYVPQAYANLWLADEVEDFFPNLYKYTNLETVSGITPREHQTVKPPKLNERQFVEDLKTSIAVGNTSTYITVNNYELEGAKIAVNLLEKRYDGWMFSFLDPITGARREMKDSSNTMINFE